MPKQVRRGPKGGAKSAPKRPGWMPDLPPAPSGKRNPPSRGQARPAPAHPGAAHAAAKHPNDPHASREAERYEHPIPSREAILKFLGDRAQLLTAEALAQELNLSHPRDFEALTKRLGAMLRDG